MSEIGQKELKEFYGKLADKPLEPTDEYYVPFHEQGNSPDDPISVLFTRID